MYVYIQSAICSTRYAFLVAYLAEPHSCAKSRR